MGLLIRQFDKSTQVLRDGIDIDGCHNSQRPAGNRDDSIYLSLLFS